MSGPPVNQYHRQVCQWLRELGIPYVEEFAVEPYSVDIYLPELRRAVEVDGPWHRRGRDLVRDEVIGLEGIEVVRVKVGTRKAECMEEILGSDPEIASSDPEIASSQRVPA